MATTVFDFVSTQFSNVSSPTSSQSAAMHFEENASQLDTTREADSSSEWDDSDTETDFAASEEDYATEEEEELALGTAPQVDIPSLVIELAPRKAIAIREFDENVRLLLKASDQPIMRGVKIYDINGLPDLRNMASTELRDWFSRTIPDDIPEEWQAFADAYPQFDGVGILAKHYTTDWAKSIFNLLTEIAFLGDISPECERLDNISYSLFRGPPIDASAVDPLVRLLFYTQPGNCIYHGEGLQKRHYYHEAMALAHYYAELTEIDCHLPSTAVIDELTQMFLQVQSFHKVLPYRAIPSKMAMAVEASLIECIRGTANIADGCKPKGIFGDAFKESSESAVHKFVASFTLSRYIYEQDIEVQEVDIGNAAIIAKSASYFRSLVSHFLYPYTY